MIEFKLPPGDQSDLEWELRKLMIARAIENPLYALYNQWGEFKILQGNILHGVQWQYVGEEVYNDADEAIAFLYNGEPDFEVSCSWHITENYQPGDEDESSE